MTLADMLASIWFNHEVTISGEEVRTAFGVTRGPDTTVMADVDAAARKVTDQYGQDVLAAATITWHVDGPLPKPGALVTVPDMFGLEPEREVITARRDVSGTGMTPDHVEVTVK